MDSEDGADCSLPKRHSKTFVMRLHPSSRRLAVLAAALAAGAVGCRLAFHLIGSRVDAQGVLREPFALLPFSTLLLLISGLALIGAWLAQRGRP